MLYKLKQGGMNYHDDLKRKIHILIMTVYKISNNFPDHEKYGLRSQLRRAVVSIMLNYVEGFARRRGNSCKVYKNFVEISYGSLSEVKYLLFLSLELEYINKIEYTQSMEISEEIGAMLWSIVR